MGKSGVDVLESLISDITKGGGCFEGIPGRRYGIMRTARHSNWWEIHDIYVGRRLASFKTWESNSGALDTYAFHVACVIDVVRVVKAVYKDEGWIGGNVIRTVGSIGGGWLGGYFGAQSGYKAGEFIGSLFGGSTQVGFCSVVGGYLGGVIGAHYGNKFVDDLLLRERDD